MNKYTVIYRKGDSERVYKTHANSKQEAYNKFRKDSNYKYNVVEIINRSAETRAAMIAVAASVIIIGLIFLSFALVFNSMKEPTPVDYIEYIVEPGDTLWEIARASDMWNKMDASIIIDDMCERSDCTATIYPGQIVYIPMYGE